MAANKTATAEGLIYKGHPLRRVDNLIYYGTMAEKYIIMMQVLDTKKEQDLDCLLYTSGGRKPPTQAVRRYAADR